MGNTDSTKKLGERVLVAKRKLEKDKTIQSERYEYLKANAPQILDATMKSITASFETCSPFSEATLLMAWMHEPETCKTIVLDSCRKVLNAPIRQTEYLWFKEYVFTSCVWMFKATNDKFMYQDLLDIVIYMSHTINDTMDSIYELIRKHAQWHRMMNIPNISYVSRQDDPKVGLLQDQGFKDLFKNKTGDEKSGEELENMKSYIDSNLAIDILISTATSINQEFQNHIKTVMSHFGTFRSGPLKKVERCVSKLENDYADAQYPKSAKLLDIIRCSITFNTVDQLIKGYNGLMRSISNTQSVIELSRVKNGFLDKSQSGYRDIKVNVIYKSQLQMDDHVNMICEIQLLLSQYLHEKKRIHKLYSILREEIYFKMVVGEEEKDSLPTHDVNPDTDVDLNDCFITTHNVGKGTVCGTDATVHQALYRNTMFIAIKELVFGSLTTSILENFQTQLSTFKALRLHHRNIVMLIGSYLDVVGGELYVFLEWCGKGSLLDLFHDDSEQIVTSFSDVLEIALSIARGMEYLHTQNIIHAKLKSSNVLFDEEYRVKVTDFFDVNANKTETVEYDEKVGSSGYDAPELFDPTVNGYDSKVDVFSYGIILWELYTSLKAIKGNLVENVLKSISPLQYVDKLKSGLRPNIPSDCPKKFGYLIQQCWEYEPQKRPTFEQVVSSLQKMAQRHKRENIINSYQIESKKHVDKREKPKHEV
eukprot:820487_1